MYVIIEDEIYNYENYTLDEQEINKIKHIVKKKGVEIRLDALFVHYLIKELKLSETYRKSFIKHVHFVLNLNNCLKIILQPTTNDLIDYNWNDRVLIMVREKCELDSALSWLSTLGGAFSALGDYFVECAETAAKISVNQYKIASRLQDPQIAARCKLYLALSLIQRKRFKTAKKIIFNEYKQASNATVIDTRLLRMCKGIWAKLQYEHYLYRKKEMKNGM